MSEPELDMRYSGRQVTGGEVVDLPCPTHGLNTHTLQLATGHNPRWVCDACTADEEEAAERAEQHELDDILDVAAAIAAAEERRRASRFEW